MAVMQGESHHCSVYIVQTAHTGLPAPACESVFLSLRNTLHILHREKLETKENGINHANPSSCCGRLEYLNPYHILK